MARETRAETDMRFLWLWWLVTLVALGVAIAAYVVGTPESLARAVWIDEVATLAMAGRGEIDWFGLTHDVHPPLHVMIVSLFRLIPEFGAVPEDARLINALFFLPLLHGLFALGRHLGWQAAFTALALLLSTGMFARHIWEVRAYFPMVALILPMTVLLAFGERRFWVYLYALVLAGLHFFGAAIALAALFVSFLVGGRSRWLDLLVLVLTLALVLAWILWTSGYLTNRIERGFWITNSWFDYRRFLVMAAIPLASATILFLPAVSRADEAGSAVWHLLLPPLLVLGATYAISLYQPVVTFRNLIVVLPHVVLLAVWSASRLSWPAYAMATLSVVSAISALGEQERMLQARQDYRWVVAETFPESCTGVPYFVANNFINETWSGVFTNVNRPRFRWEDYTADIERLADHPTCDRLGFGHYPAPNFGLAEIARTFAGAGIAVRIETKDGNVPGHMDFVVIRE